MTLTRATLKPGWKWSKSVKPIAKTDICQFRHVGYLVSGRLKVVLNDGSAAVLGPGDSFEIPPDHDAWVVGKKPVTMLDFESATAAQYAKPSP